MIFEDEVVVGPAAAEKLDGSVSSGTTNAIALADSSGTTSSVALAVSCGGDGSAVSLACVVGGGAEELEVVPCQTWLLVSCSGLQLPCWRQ